MFLPRSVHLCTKRTVSTCFDRSFSNSLLHRSESDFANFASTTRLVACIGRNYVDHIKELGNVQGKEPFFFLKPPSSILPPNGGSVLLPGGVSSHYEVELGFVMAKQTKDFSVDSPFESSIAGYFLAIDMTARNMQDENKKKGLPWTTAKGFDTYLPVSKYIPASTIRDAHDLTLRLSVNGSVKQDDGTNLMIYKIPRILAHISSIMTLNPGDIVITGTPKGVGRVVAGDVMEASLYQNGEEVVDARIKVVCEDRIGGYMYKS